MNGLLKRGTLMDVLFVDGASNGSGNSYPASSRIGYDYTTSSGKYDGSRSTLVI